MVFQRLGAGIRKLCVKGRVQDNSQAGLRILDSVVSIVAEGIYLENMVKRGVYKD